jgi:two-component system, NarL family, invasion response regulator UvrY
MNSFTQEKLRILILDDHPVVRRGLRQILTEGFDPLEFGEGKTGSEGLSLALSQPWDLIVAIDLPDREGLDVLDQLKKIRPDQLILVLAVRVTEGQVEVRNNPDELVSAVRRVLASGTNGRSTVAMEAPADLRGRRSHKNLSKREQEVLRLIGLGKTVRDIAAVLVLSDKTISTYRRRMLTKLGLKTTAELIRYALMNGLAD